MIDGKMGTGGLDRRVVMGNTVIVASRASLGVDQGVAEVVELGIGRTVQLLALAGLDQTGNLVTILSAGLQIQ